MAFAVAAKNPIVSPLAGLRDTQLGDAGSYFTAVPGTLGTGTVTATSVNTFDETKPTFLLYNAGPFSIYPMVLQTHITVIGADATPSVVNWTITMDVGNRFTSGGSALTIFSDTLSPSRVSGAFIQVGAITATAKTPSRRITANLTAKDTVLEVVHDTMIISWGDTQVPWAESVASNAAAPAYPDYMLPPCVIGPNQSFLMTAWSATQTTGSTREYVFSWVEK